jgi:hypothetical protein
MTDHELTTVEGLVRQYAAELVPRINEEQRLVAYFPSVSAAFLAALVVLRLLGPEVPAGLTLFVTGAFTMAGVGVGEWIVRNNHENARRHLAHTLTATPSRFYHIIVQKFSLEIERQRANTLGSSSKWGRAREPLARAAQEAARSVAYWKQRLATDPNNQVAQQQLDTANGLKKKFETALTELDARSAVLVSFFNECEARLAVLQHTKRDYEEAHKLSVLTEQADSVVSAASTTLALIGQAFIEEARRVGQALGAVERLGILNLAASVPVEHVEALADRIHENSLRERDALERLVAGVSPLRGGNQERKQ